QASKRPDTLSVKFNVLGDRAMAHRQGPFPASRRDFIILFGGAAAAWPHAARAEEVKRLGVLMNSEATDPQAQSHLATFIQGLRKLGWIDGKNLRTEVRWGASDVNRTDAYATDLVELLRPDVLLAATTINLVALQRATRTIPIVFTQARDPVA